MVPCTCCSCTIDGEFSEVSGTWDVEATPITGSGAGEILYSGAPATFADPYLICVTPRTDDSAAVCQIRFNREDASNFHFVEIELDSGIVTARFGRAIAGVSAYVGAAITLGIDIAVGVPICICFTPGESQAETGGDQTCSPTAVEDVSNSWTDEENALPPGDDNLSATHSMTEDTNTGTLRFTGFPFALPPGAIPTGVEIAAQVEFEADDGLVVDSTAIYATITETSDNAATLSQVPDAASNGGQTWGGSSDLLGANPTWEEINDPDNFLVALAWLADGPVGSSSLFLDRVVCTVWWTLPPYEPADVTLSVDGDCVARIKLAFIGEWLGHSLAITTGDWEFADPSLSYAESDTRPSCPACCTTTAVPCACCTGEVSSQYSVDLGTTGFADTGCNCDAISGTFIVDFVGSTFSTCDWRYADNAACGLLIALRINRIGGDGQCYWWLTIFTNEGILEYTSTPFDFDDCPADEVTLDYFAGPTTLCGTSVPASVTIEPL